MTDLEPSYPGAVAPERTRLFPVGALRLRLYEWGDPSAEPFVLCHGMWDHGRGFDVLAPLLAERYRVVAVDARGHGESSWADAYSFMDNVHDLCHVLRSFGQPVRLLGHSRGGSIATEAAAHLRSHVRKLINIDGFGPPLDIALPPGMPESPSERLSQFMDRRKRVERDFRVAADVPELMERRRRTNPRLSDAWLAYFAYHAARRVEQGFTWKCDPSLADSFGIGPWFPDWITQLGRMVQAPLLAITGTESDFFSPASEALLDRRLALVPNVQRARVAGAGHFVHMEKPRETAALILDFVRDGCS